MIALGGFAAFSTYAVDVERLVDGGRPGVALAYPALTVVWAVALAVVWAVAVAARRAMVWRMR
jgi:CrcB protein